MPIPKPSPTASLLKKTLWFALHRPGRVFGAIRNIRTFWVTHQLFRLLPAPGIALARNARVQRFGCLMAEAPDARITIGEHTIVFETTVLEAYGRGRIDVGADSSLGGMRIYSRGRVSIGSHFLGSWNILVQDFSPHPTDPAQRALQNEWSCRNFEPSWATAEDKRLPTLDWDFSPGEIVIGDRVWIGAQCVVLKNARIGSGCIVAAGSVVTAGDYPPNSLLAGNPAKVVRTLAPTETPTTA
jgi:acetyltransferase-like isoleucine patch superfamily enzyme